MKQISNKILIYSDENYRHAVNYSQHLYNFPITLNYGKKHSRTKYMLPSGTSDNIEIWGEGIFLYVLSQNNRLEYLSLFVINTESKTIDAEIFLNSTDINSEENICYEILEKESKEQIKILLEYC